MPGSRSDWRFLLLEREFRRIVFGQFGGLSGAEIASTFAVSLLTVGVGFLLHELAHQVVAVRADPIVHQRDNGFVVVLEPALVGFLNALFDGVGPVADHSEATRPHRRRWAGIGPRLVLCFSFRFPPQLWASEDLRERHGGPEITPARGFNMQPFGPLDGRTVREWSSPVFLAVAVPSTLLGVGALFVL